jgi:hypothetical protein
MNRLMLKPPFHGYGIPAYAGQTIGKSSLLTRTHTAEAEVDTAKAEVDTAKAEVDTAPPQQDILAQQVEDLPTGKSLLQGMEEP